MITVATLKHIASKSADYKRALEYLIFEHNENGAPLRDEAGNKLMRDQFILDGINCVPWSFDKECEVLNVETGKNRKYDEIKSHHYIISFDPKDRDERGLTPEHAQELGMEFASRCFPGHQMLVCTHNDGHNESGNIHVHIIMNSVRKLDVPREPFMEREIDSRAGYKHHPTDRFMNFIKGELMRMCEREGLHQVDLISPAKNKITNEEYRARQRGQERLDELNREIVADGMTPARTVFQTQKQYLRDAILDAAERSSTLKEFEGILKEEYRIVLKDRRGRFSYLHPDRGKYITGRALGSDYEMEAILERIRLNAFEAEEPPEEINEAGHEERQEAANNSVRQEHGNDAGTPVKNNVFERPTTEYDPSFDYYADPVAILYVRTNLRLVIDLQTCIKAQQSEAYAEEVELTNLLEMSRTVAYIQEQGIGSKEELDKKCRELSDMADKAKEELDDIDQQLKKINEQIHFAGRYYASRSVHNDFMKTWSKGRFRSRHREELAQYDEAVTFFKDNNDGTIPSMKDLKERKENLVTLREEKRDAYRGIRNYHKDLQTAVQNVEMILGSDPDQSFQIETQRKGSRSHPAHRQEASL